MTAISWINGGFGLWSDSTDWSSGTVPGPADDVTIAIAPNPGQTSYTVEINTVVDVHSVTLDQAAAVLQVGDFNGDGALSTQLYLDAGTLELASGTLTGTVTQTGGTVEVGGQGDLFGSGTLQNVSWQGDFQPIFSPGPYGDAGELIVQGGLTLTGATGTGPGTLTLEQTGAIEFQGQQTLDNATVYLGDADASYEPSTLGAESYNGTAGALTLGANLLLDANGYSEINGGLIINDGAISANGSALLYVVSGTLANTGQVTIDAGGLVAFNGGSLINDGIITVAAGGTLVLTLGDGSTWQNGGALLDNGLVKLDGILTVGNLQSFPITEGAGGALELGGTLVNTGTDLVLGSGGVAPNLVLGGTIVGGTITGANNLLFDAGDFGVLNDVTVSGGISLTGSSEQLTIANGIQFTKGGLTVTGNSDIVSILGTTSLNGVVVQMGSQAGDTLTASGGQLTLGATTRLLVDAGSATLDGGVYGSPGSVMNGGVITVSNGAELTVGDGSSEPITQDSFDNQGKIDVSGNSILYIATPNLINTGTIKLTDSTLLLGQATAAELAAFKLVDSTTAVAGTLTATGATLNFGPLNRLTIGVAAPGMQSNASVVGGTLHDTDGGIQILGTVSLTGVTYQGLMAIDAPSSNVALTDVTVQNVSGTAPGRLVLSGNGAQLVIAGTTTFGTLVMSGSRVGATIAVGKTLDNATVDIGSTGGATIEGYQGAEDPPALGAHLIVDQTGEYATIAGNYFVSSATINAAYAGGFMTFYGFPFINEGAITVGASETVTSAANEFINVGTVAVSGGGILLLTLGSYYGDPPASGTSFENEGLMALSGGTVHEMSGRGVPPVPLLNGGSGLISGSGMIASEVANYGTISADNGALTLTGAVSGHGTLQISSDATLSLLGAVAAREVAQFGGADGVLGLAPVHFLGEIGGFAAGDTIDVLKTAASAASFSGSSIVVTLTAGGTIALHTTSALSGALTVTSDGQGGSLIGFADSIHVAANVSAQAWDYAQPTENGFVRPIDLTNALQNVWDTMLHHGLL